MPAKKACALSSDTGANGVDTTPLLGKLGQREASSCGPEGEFGGADDFAIIAQ